MDVYAFAVLCWEMLTGRVPWRELAGHMQVFGTPLLKYSCTRVVKLASQVLSRPSRLVLLLTAAAAL